MLFYAFSQQTKPNNQVNVSDLAWYFLNKQIYCLKIIFHAQTFENNP